MHVLALTILISLCLAGIFIVSFSLEARRRHRASGSPEHDALIPFDDLDPRPELSPSSQPLPAKNDTHIPQTDSPGL